MPLQIFLPKLYEILLIQTTPDRLSLSDFLNVPMILLLVSRAKRVIIIRKGRPLTG